MSAANGDDGDDGASYLQEDASAPFTTHHHEDAADDDDEDPHAANGGGGGGGGAARKVSIVGADSAHRSSPNKRGSISRKHRAAGNAPRAGSIFNVEGFEDLDQFSSAQLRHGYQFAALKSHRRQSQAARKHSQDEQGDGDMSSSRRRNTNTTTSSAASTVDDGDGEGDADVGEDRGDASSAVASRHQECRALRFLQMCNGYRVLQGVAAMVRCASGDASHLQEDEQQRQRHHHGASTSSPHRARSTSPGAAASPTTKAGQVVGLVREVLHDLKTKRRQESPQASPMNEHHGHGDADDAPTWSPVRHHPADDGKSPSSAGGSMLQALLLGTSSGAPGLGLLVLAQKQRRRRVTMAGVEEGNVEDEAEAETNHGGEEESGALVAFQATIDDSNATSKNAKKEAFEKQRRRRMQEQWKRITYGYSKKGVPSAEAIERRKAHERELTKEKSQRQRNLLTGKRSSSSNGGGDHRRQSTSSNTSATPYTASKEYAQSFRRLSTVQQNRRASTEGGQRRASAGGGFAPAPLEAQVPSKNDVGTALENTRTHYAAIPFRVRVPLVRPTPPTAPAPAPAAASTAAGRGFRVASPGEATPFQQLSSPLTAAAGASRSARTGGVVGFADAGDDNNDMKQKKGDVENDDGISPIRPASPVSSPTGGAGSDSRGNSPTSANNASSYDDAASCDDDGNDTTPGSKRGRKKRNDSSNVSTDDGGSNANAAVASQGDISLSIAQRTLNSAVCAKLAYSVSHCDAALADQLELLSPAVTPTTTTTSSSSPSAPSPSSHHSHQHGGGRRSEKNAALLRVHSWGVEEVPLLREARPHQIASPHTVQWLITSISNTSNAATTLAAAGNKESRKTSVGASHFSASPDHSSSHRRESSQQQPLQQQQPVITEVTVAVAWDAVPREFFTADVAKCATWSPDTVLFEVAPQPPTVLLEERAVHSMGVLGYGELQQLARLHLRFQFWQEQMRWEAVNCLGWEDAGRVALEKQWKAQLMQLVRRPPSHIVGHIYKAARDCLADDLLIDVELGHLSACFDAWMHYAVRKNKAKQYRRRHRRGGAGAGAGAGAGGVSPSAASLSMSRRGGGGGGDRTPPPVALNNPTSQGEEAHAEENSPQQQHDQDEDERQELLKKLNSTVVARGVAERLVSLAKGVSEQRKHEIWFEFALACWRRKFARHAAAIAFQPPEEEEEENEHAENKDEVNGNGEENKSKDDDDDTADSRSTCKRRFARVNAAAATAVRAVLPTVTSALRALGIKGECVTVTGHGAGGAIATLLALELNRHALSCVDVDAQPQATTVTTFGTPKVFSSEDKLTKVLRANNLTSVRVVDRRDPAPYQPHGSTFLHSGRDLFVVGSGSGGSSGAEQSAEKLLCVGSEPEDAHGMVSAFALQHWKLHDVDHYVAMACDACNRHPSVVPDPLSVAILGNHDLLRQLTAERVMASSTTATKNATHAFTHSALVVLASVFMHYAVEQIGAGALPQKAQALLNKHLKSQSEVDATVMMEGSTNKQPTGDVLLSSAALAGDPSLAHIRLSVRFVLGVCGIIEPKLPLHLIASRLAPFTHHHHQHQQTSTTTAAGRVVLGATVPLKGFLAWMWVEFTLDPQFVVEFLRVLDPRFDPEMMTVRMTALKKLGPRLMVEDVPQMQAMVSRTHQQGGGATASVGVLEAAFNPRFTAAGLSVLKHMFTHYAHAPAHSPMEVRVPPSSPVASRYCLRKLLEDGRWTHRVPAWQVAGTVLSQLEVAHVKNESDRDVTIGGDLTESGFGRFLKLLLHFAGEPNFYRWLWVLGYNHALQHSITRGTLRNIHAGPDPCICIAKDTHRQHGGVLQREEREYREWVAAEIAEIQSNKMDRSRRRSMLRIKSLASMPESRTGGAVVGFQQQQQPTRKVSGTGSNAGGGGGDSTALQDSILDSEGDEDEEDENLHDGNGIFDEDVEDGNDDDDEEVGSRRGKPYGALPPHAQEQQRQRHEDHELSGSRSRQGNAASSLKRRLANTLASSAYHNTEECKIWQAKGDGKQLHKDNRVSLHKYLHQTRIETCVATSQPKKPTRKEILAVRHDWESRRQQKRAQLLAEQQSKQRCARNDNSSSAEVAAPPPPLISTKAGSSLLLKRKGTISTASDSDIGHGAPEGTEEEQQQELELRAWSAPLGGYADAPMPPPSSGDGPSFLPDIVARHPPPSSKGYKSATPTAKNISSINGSKQNAQPKKKKKKNTPTLSDPKKFHTLYAKIGVVRLLNPSQRSVLGLPVPQNSFYVLPDQHDDDDDDYYYDHEGKDDADGGSTAAAAAEDYEEEFAYEDLSVQHHDYSSGGNGAPDPSMA